MMIGMAVLVNDWNTAFLNMRIGRGLSSFFAGVLLGYFCIHTHGSKICNALCGAVIVGSSIVMIKVGLSGNLYISAVFIFAALVFTLENLQCIGSILTKKVVHAIWAPISDLSYELFLSHYPILTGIAILDRIFDLDQYYDSIWFFACYVTLSILLAAVMKGLEKLVRPPLQTFLNLSGDE